MIKRQLKALKIVSIACLTLLMTTPAIAETLHLLEARLAPAAVAPEGAALAVRYNQGIEARLTHDWQSIAVLSGLAAHPDSSQLHYRLIIEQVDRVRASTSTVSVQYRLVVLE